MVLKLHNMVNEFYIEIIQLTYINWFEFYLRCDSDDS